MWLRIKNKYVRDSDVLQFEVSSRAKGWEAVEVTTTSDVFPFKFQSEQTASFFVEQIIKAISLKEDEVYTYCGRKAQYAAEPNFAYVDEIYDAVRAECGEATDAP